ncbi:sugar phosphate isomerase/epimerase family protein [Paenibacillus agricola]|uniref:Sugar phosphate isomerase/epimerase n=1 Tax=Paenibacillus agricola TaxID=2716264 RepID=A0ABX0J4X5_9BACL|nr:sugar phosphate isomerase/epimerase family protein [Paenibacillus agricola]NHN29893.1 sugar phosphate isomerase/epimerase [Paenibacillus agricola]
MSTVPSTEESFAKVYEQIPTSHYLIDNRKGPYYTGDYKIGLNLYSFNHNLNSWLQGSTEGAPPVDTMQLIRFAKEAGFDSLDITAYYIPGYQKFAMPTKPDEEILEYARNMKRLSDELGIAISCTGVKNDFADPSDERRALDVKHVKYWIDVAVAMGAPLMRVFSAEIPNDLLSSDWETIAKQRIVPALRECAEYGAAKGVKIGMQNHGDMTSTADQVIRILQWVDHPNLGVVNDMGSYRRFQAKTGEGYDWYDDIEAVFPYSLGFQLKTKPAGPNTETLTDLEQFFTRLRYSNYRGYIPIETLWGDADKNHPKHLSDPPYDQITDFLALIRAASESTKVKMPSSIDPTSAV